MPKKENLMNSTEQKGGGQRLIIAFFAVIIVLLLVVIVILLSKDRGGTAGVEVDDKESVRNIVVTHDNIDEVADQMKMPEYVAPGYYEATMTNVWHFKTSDSISEDAFVENKKTNTNDVYFDVFLASDETDPILQSPVIPRGAELDNIALDKILSPGTYDCVLIYHLVDENQNTVSTLRVGIEIVIEN